MGLQLRLKGVLHVAEHVAGARQSEGHSAQLTKDLMSLLHAGPLLSHWNAGNDLSQPLYLVWRQVRTVMLTVVSMILPSITLIVLHEQLPCCIFLSDTGSC